MFDRLTIINRALISTGNEPVQLNDGSPAWQHADVAFGYALDDFLSQHSWPFARTSADLVLADPSPAVQFAHAFALPPGLLHLRAVFVDGIQSTRFVVMGRKLCCDVPSGVAIEYIAEPAEMDWHPQATVCLTMFLEARIMMGFNEDERGGQARLQAAMIKMVEVRAQLAGENPARNAFLGSATIARARRRG